MMIVAITIIGTLAIVGLVYISYQHGYANATEDYESFLEFMKIQSSNFNNEEKVDEKCK